MKTSWTLSLLIGLGGFAGTLARYGLHIVSQRFTFEWPLGTLTANVGGCFLVGIIAGLSARIETLSPEVRIVLASGFCGGFTTLSSLVYETAEMVRANDYAHALLYVAGSIGLSMSAFIVGLLAIRVLVRAGGGM